MVWITLWSILLICLVVLSLAASFVNTTNAFKVHAVMSAPIWVLLFIYVVTLKVFYLKIMMFTIIQVLLHLFYAIVQQKDMVMFNSASIVLLLGLNQWGVDAFEMLAMTITVEIASWILIFFVHTLTA